MQGGVHMFVRTSVFAFCRVSIRKTNADRQHAPLLERDDFLLNILRAHAVAPHRASHGHCCLQTPSPRALALPAFNAEQWVADLLSRKQRACWSPEMRLALNLDLERVGLRRDSDACRSRFDRRHVWRLEASQRAHPLTSVGGEGVPDRVRCIGSRARRAPRPGTPTSTVAWPCEQCTPRLGGVQCKAPCLGHHRNERPVQIHAPDQPMRGLSPRAHAGSARGCSGERGRASSHAEGQAAHLR